MMDCKKHAGQDNEPNRAPLDRMMEKLPRNQSGAGRHKCPYCAYKKGIEDGLRLAREEIERSREQPAFVKPIAMLWGFPPVRRIRD